MNGGRELYRGVWPQNVGRLAKYGVRSVEGRWTVTVLYQADEGLRYLAVEGAGEELADQINAIKLFAHQQLGGAFYINEYRHVIVPVSAPDTSGTLSHYYYASRLETDLTFEFEGRALTTRPVDLGGAQLAVGARWVGPRPGIPYVLAAGGADVYYETPALTDQSPPTVRPRMTRRVLLSRVLGDGTPARRAAEPVFRVRGHQGGRFYVNEHGAMFTPVGADDGNGIDYLYCGQIDRSIWFPEPPVPGGA